MSQEHGDLTKDPNYQTYLRLKGTGELPEGRYVSIVQGELVTSGDDREEVIRETSRLMEERSIQGKSVLVQDKENDDKVVHLRSPRIVRN